MRVLSRSEVISYGINPDPDPDQDGLWFFIWIAVPNKAWQGKVENLAKVLGGRISKGFSRRHTGGYVFIVMLPLNCLANPNEMPADGDFASSLFVRLPGASDLRNRWHELGGPALNHVDYRDIVKLIGGTIRDDLPQNVYVLLETPVVVSSTARIEYDNLIAAIAGTTFASARAFESSLSENGPDQVEISDTLTSLVNLKDPPVLCSQTTSQTKPANGPLEHIYKLILIIWGMAWDNILEEAEETLGFTVDWGASNEGLPYYRMNEPLGVEAGPDSAHLD
jgi:hypothetical protein